MLLSLKWENLKVTDFPKTHRWRLPEMRKTSLIETTIIWRIGFNGRSLIFWTGKEDEKLSLNKETLDISPKINHIAWYRAMELYLDKRSEGYFPPCIDEYPLITIMRGENYSNSMKLNFPVDVDDKLDGQRMYCRTNFPYDAEGLTRGNNHFPNVSMILEEVKAFSIYLPSKCIIDGEIWHPNYRLSEITSIIKSKDDPRMKELEYHIFDLWWDEDLSQEIRRKLLERAISLHWNRRFGYVSIEEYGTGGRPKSLIGKTKLFVTVIHVANTHDDIERIHRHNVDNRRLEGSIVRKRANENLEDSAKYNMSRYSFGKGTHILKVLDFIYEEGLCIKVLDSNGIENGCAILVIKDIRGNIMSMKPEGDQSLRRKWLQTPSIVVGKYVTFKYKCLSTNNIPMRATVKNVRDEIGWSPDIQISIDPQDNFHGDY